MYRAVFIDNLLNSLSFRLAKHLLPGQNKQWPEKGRTFHLSCFYPSRRRGRKPKAILAFFESDTPRRPASITNDAVCLPIIQRRKILPEELLITCSNSYSLFIYIIFYYEYFEHGFLLDLARVQLLPSAAASRKEPRNAVCSANGM